MDCGFQKNKQLGAIMIEVLVSSLIGTLMLYGALSIMLTSRTTYLARDGLSRVEERGRLALEILSDDIRMSGYRGCVSGGSQPVIKGINLSQSWMKPELGIRGWNYTTADFDFMAMDASAFSSADWAGGGGETAKPTSIQMVEESDVIELWKAYPYVMDITATDTAASPMTMTADTATITGVSGVTESSGNLLMVSDCSRNLLVKANSINETSGAIALAPTDNNAVDRTNTQAEQLSSMTLSQGVILQGIVYFLAIPSYGDRPSLYRKEIKADGTLKDKTEILTGILNLQFLYGESTNDAIGVERYVEAQDVSDWTKVVSVRIFVLVETENNNVVPEGQDFYYFDQVHTPENDADRRIRRQYSTTVTLRNRSLGLVLSGGD